MKLRSGFVLLFLFVWSTLAHTASPVSPATTIKSIEFYYHQSGSDVVVKVDKKETDCPSGYWFSHDDPSYFDFMRVLNSAYVKHMDVQLDGDETKNWPGSVEKVCRLTRISSLTPV